MNGLNGIIIDGKGYELIERGREPACPGCALYDPCSKNWARRGHQPCLITAPSGNRIFRFSQSLTDKINEK